MSRFQWGFRVLGSAVLLGCLLVGMLAVQSFAAGFLVDDNFNGDPVGAKPAGYEIEETGGKVGVAAFPSEAEKSLFLDDPGDKVIKVTKVFAPQSGTVVAEIAFLQPVVSSTAKVIRLLDKEKANAAVHLETRSGAKLAYKNGDGSFTEIGDYQAGVWYNFKIVADVAAQKADIYLGNELKLKQVPFLAPVKEIGALDSYTPGSSARGHYLDNIRVAAE
ncbi:hypothetical protein EDC14_101777 [Hydrogenispora ethanolica]|uniref:Uncharacterized protein n=1 Tax=Hydrogenispora ethanolica TaxID=1082276 RepID=A0A4R1RHD0_HYDET|nr:hypothetical protein [Hydrogenispora ethanolica]TCL65329.1 hypothetical protein EDC14_101777 [Hydrogenispora ethanolica]